MRIAMWSGPRNLSTAMMYSFGARRDTAVWDEPYYGAYLKATGLDHPLSETIISQMECDPTKIAARCAGEIPDGKSVFYQKHMPHHMLPEFDRGWISDVVNVFLIRHPARVIASYHAKRENPTLEDIGFVQQAELFDQIAQRTGHAPVVIDSFDIRTDPRRYLRKLCDAIGLPWDESMLSWSKGGHKDDGVWAKHWYPAVWNSTGFADAERPLPVLSGDLKILEDQALGHYEKLAAQKL